MWAVHARLARLSPLFFVGTTAALVWPVYPLFGDHVEPRVFGLPWSLVWVLGVIVADTAVLIALFVTRMVDAAEADEHV